MNDENSNSQNSPENKKRSWYWEDKPVSPFVGNASMMPSLMVCNGCPGWQSDRSGYHGSFADETPLQ